LIPSNGKAHGHPIPGGEEEAMARSRRAGAYLDGFAVVRSVLDLDELTAFEILCAFTPEEQDSLLTPWKRGFNAAIRSAFGY